MAKKTMIKKKAKRDPVAKRKSEAHYAVPHNPPGEIRHISDAPSSIEFSRDAKKQPRWSIKLYGETDSMDDTVTEILALDKRLREDTSG